MSKSKKPAAINNEQGILLCKQIRAEIKSRYSLRGSEFGLSVNRSVKDMERRLEEGAFFSESMERALQNWNEAINRNIKPKSTIN